MSYQSIDQLQKALTRDVFSHTDSPKKAAGRALGTLIEIITFYALKSWGFERDIAIERPLPEFANGDITHNVEFSLHPAIPIASVEFSRSDLPISSRRIVRENCLDVFNIPTKDVKSTQLLNRGLVLRNACTVYDGGEIFLNAYLDNLDKNHGHYSVLELQRRPYAIFECKRVGVEEGMKKGPQSIEKAKQGAYVARTVSSLQRIRMSDGKIGGIIQQADGTLRSGDYYKLMDEIIKSNDMALLGDFILTVGVVSNHGNWFTAENHNKELKVLAQSYDWLLFLTDEGVAKFVTDLLLKPTKTYQAASTAFLASYASQKKSNQFTKVQMSLDADAALQQYFKTNAKEIEAWFNIIAPSKKKLTTLQEELKILRAKPWPKAKK